MLSTRFTEHLAMLGFVMFLGCAAVALDSSTYPGDVISLRQHISLFAEDTGTQIFSTSYTEGQIFSAENTDSSYVLTILSLHSSTLCLIPWYPDVSKKSMLVDEDRSLTVSMENKCPFSVQVTLGIDAPDFKLKQADPTFSIIPNGSYPWKGVLQAQRPCSPCDIAINAYAENMNDLSPWSGSRGPGELLTLTPEPSLSFEISVSGTFSIYTLLLKLFNSISTVLGSMLTIPWWYEQWQKHKDRERDAHSSKITSHLRKNGTRSKKRRKSK
jgi:hypothetical protein